MKAEELMVGDWVVYDGDTEYDAPIKIEGMDISTNSLITSDREDVGFDGVQPIPITQEILEKNFTKTEVRVLVGTKTHYIEIDDFYCVALNEYTDSIWEFEYMNLEAHFPLVSMFVSHVHELQHALLLCGIDKEIEL